LKVKVRVIPHKRGNGKWAVDYYCPVTRKRRYESFPTKRQAIARKKELEGKAATGEYVPVERRTWTEFRTEYEQRVLKLKRSVKTKICYRQALDTFERLCTPHLLINISTRVIEEFAAKRLAEGVSCFTVNKELRVLRAALRTAHRWCYVQRLPEFKMLKTPDKEPRAIPPDQFERILAVASTLDERFAESEARRRVPKRKNVVRGPAHNPPGSEWWVAFLSTAYLAGLRWGELLALRWGDLNFAAKPSIKVWNQKAGRYDEVPICETLRKHLHEWMAVCPDVDDRALVFPHDCHDRTLSATWTRIQKWAGIERPYRFHDLRVSYCTNLVAAGTEAATLQKLARHRSLETTLRFYRGKTVDADRRAVQAMEEQVLARRGE